MVVNHLSASKLEEDQDLGLREAKANSQWKKKKKKYHVQYYLQHL